MVLEGRMGFGNGVIEHKTPDQKKISWTV